MDAEKLAVFAEFVEPGDKLIVECDGYELEPYAIEYDEYAGALVVKCISPDDDDEDDDEQPDVCALPERQPGEEPELVVG